MVEDSVSPTVRFRRNPAVILVEAARRSEFIPKIVGGNIYRFVPRGR
jgi:hypothetical protein